MVRILTGVDCLFKNGGPRKAKTDRCYHRSSRRHLLLAITARQQCRRRRVSRIRSP